MTGQQLKIKKDAEERRERLRAQILSQLRQAPHRAKQIAPELGVETKSEILAELESEGKIFYRSKAWSINF